MQARAYGFGVFYGCLRVQPSFIDENVPRRNAELKGHSFHSFRLMNGTLAWATGKEQLLYQAAPIKLAGRSHAIRQCIRRVPIRIYTRAKDHGDICGAAIIRLAEEDHLGKGKCTRACRAECEARSDTSAPRLGLRSIEAGSQD